MTAAWNDRGPAIDLESLPDLDIPVGVAGSMRYSEVGGEVCYAVVVAVTTYGAMDSAAAR
jgi:hypothetical protein